MGGGPHGKAGYHRWTVGRKPLTSVFLAASLLVGGLFACPGQVHAGFLTLPSHIAGTESLETGMHSLPDPSSACGMGTVQPVRDSPLSTRGSLPPGEDPEVSRLTWPQSSYGLYAQAGAGVPPRNNGSPEGSSSQSLAWQARPFFLRMRSRRSWTPKRQRVSPPILFRAFFRPPRNTMALIPNNFPVQLMGGS